MWLFDLFRNRDVVAGELVDDSEIEEVSAKEFAGEVPRIRPMYFEELALAELQSLKDNGRFFNYEIHHDIHLIEFLQNHMDFSDVPSYEKWLERWKMDYSDLKHNIRYHKRGRRPMFQPDDEKRFNNFHLCQRLKLIAYFMLIVRQESKKRATKIYEESNSKQSGTT